MYLQLEFRACLPSIVGTPGCAFFDKSRHSKGGKGCRAACPIWVQGSLRGEYIRRALNLRSWEAASELVRARDASGTIGVVKPDVPTVSEAVQKFFADAQARKLSASTISKQKNILGGAILVKAAEARCGLIEGFAYRHFTTRPDECRSSVNGPSVSFESLSRIVNTIVLDATEPEYVAGWLSGTSPWRMGPPCSRTNVPATSN